MRVLIYNRNVYFNSINSMEGIGGAEKQQWLLCKALVNRGHEAVVMVPGLEGPEREIEGVRFVGCSARNPVFTAFGFLRRLRPDWWYWECNSYLLGPLFFIARMLGIATVFACAFDTDCMPRIALSRRKALWPLYAWGLRLADRVVVQHPHQKDLLKSEYRQKAYQVNNIVEIPENQTGLDKEPYVAWVAVLRYPKRPHLLVEIAQALPDTRFVVCGPTSEHRSPPGYSQNILRSFEEIPNIEYRGGVPPQEAREVIASSTLFLSTSEGEGFPNTFLEAWAAGTPVISLGVDPGNVIKTRHTGIVTETVEDTVDQIRKVLSNPDTQELGDRGKRYVTEEHSAQVVGAQLENALQSHGRNGL